MRNLKELYAEFLEMGAVYSQREFSRLWGMEPSWFSSTTSRGREPGIYPLCMFRIQIDRIKADTEIALSETDNEDEAEALTEGLEELKIIRDEMEKAILEKAMMRFSFLENKTIPNPVQASAERTR
ncbi:hypothetical protein [Paramagnetospirillum caucaseum]|uniref:hypothetical protein n=1 Tax=Paramagnetospirillum caucaseum TaxID=1244869 RepID=UPI001267E73E|nr:hypothetical protein [Paramagnetospirillum caucaseum]